MSAMHDGPAECCICFDALCEEPVAALFDQHNKRVCSHYFHFDCVKEMCPFVTRGYGMEMEVEEGGDAELTCPMCRVPFASIARMPNHLEDPYSWFRFVDSDNTGFLSFNNVRDLVNAMCMIDQRQLVKLLKENWSTWDRWGNGIFPDALPMLLQFVLAHSPRRRDAQGRTRQTAPSIVENKEAWFDYWDEDRSGALDRGETARALVKTFEKGTISPQQIREIQSTLENVWAVFDVNRSNTITRAEFLMSDGLADTIAAMLERRQAVEARTNKQQQQQQLATCLPRRKLYADNTIAESIQEIKNLPRDPLVQAPPPYPRVQAPPGPVFAENGVGLAHGPRPVPWDRVQGEWESAPKAPEKFF